MDWLASFISEHYVAAGLIALLGVYLMLIAHGLTGEKRILKAASLQWAFVVMMMLTTPFVIWALTSMPKQ